MRKVFTRGKRKFRMHTHINGAKAYAAMKPRTSPKVFRTEQAAQAFAEKQGLKTFKIVNVSLSPDKQKFKIIRRF